MQLWPCTSHATNRCDNNLSSFTRFIRLKANFPTRIIARNCWLSFNIVSFEVMNISQPGGKWSNPQKSETWKRKKKNSFGKLCMQLHKKCEKETECSCVFCFKYFFAWFRRIALAFYLLTLVLRTFLSVCKEWDGCWEKVKVGKCTFPALCTPSVYSMLLASYMVFTRPIHSKENKRKTTE